MAMADKSRVLLAYLLGFLSDHETESSQNLSEAVAALKSSPACLSMP